MLVVIRGAGDIATGIALRLYRCGFRLVLCEVSQPTDIRRTVCFAEAVRLGRTTVEGVEARRADLEEVPELLEDGIIPVLVDPAAACVPALGPGAVVDAILAKRNLGTTRDMAPVVVGVGPGFTAGADCHAAVETMRGHTLGRVIYQGSPWRTPPSRDLSAAMPGSGSSVPRRTAYSRASAGSGTWWRPGT